MRKSFSPKERLRLFDLHGGVCWLCDVVIDQKREAWEVEHTLALALGGDNSDDNLRPAHVRCHKAKTAADVGKTAKANRQRNKYLGARTSRWPKSPYRRKVNGETVRRDTDA